MGLMGMLLMVLGGIVILGINIYLLSTRSQSIGKIVMKTQIADFNTRQPANFVSAFVLRGFVNWLIGLIPCVGGFYALADILFVFSDDHRCLHDRIANTIVLDIGD